MKSLVTVTVLVVLSPLRLDAQPLLISGVKLSMTYAQVVATRGYPSAVEIQQGYGHFTYGKNDGVWFLQGRVVEVHGVGLQGDGRDPSEFPAALGQPEPIYDTMRQVNQWWPAHRLAAWRDQESNFQNFSLCQAEPPYKYQWGANPWANDVRESNQLDGISLGGKNHQPWFAPRVTYTASGHAIRVRGLKLKNRFKVGYHDFSRGDLEVGQAPQQSLLGHPWKLPREGTYRDQTLIVEMHGGLVASLELRLDDEPMIAALGGCKPCQPGPGGD